METGYDYTIHIDDSQFDDLLNTIVTGELPTAEIKVNADTEEAENEISELTEPTYVELTPEVSDGPVPMTKSTSESGFNRPHSRTPKIEEGVVEVFKGE